MHILLEPGTDLLLCSLGCSLRVSQVLGTRKAVPEETPKSVERVVLGNEGYAAHVATLRKELAAKRQAKKASVCSS